MKSQLKLGILTTGAEITFYKPDYYRWNQWFLQILKGLVEKDGTVNWCEKSKPYWPTNR